MTRCSRLRARGRLRRRGGRARPVVRRRARRDRRPHRAERRGEVDDAARDHGARPGPRRGDPPRRRVAARALARGRRSQRRRARSGGTAALRGADAWRRTSGSGSRRAQARRASTEDLAEVYELFPVVRGVPRPPRGGALGRPAAAARDRAGARRAADDPPPRRAVARARADGGRPRLLDARDASRERGIAVLLVEQRAQRTVALADRTHVLANGELRLTLTPGRRGRHRAHGRGLPLVIFASGLSDFVARRRRPAGPGRRDRARRHLRPHGRRHRPRLRRPAARQLRVRAADHGRRVRARLRLGARLARRGRDRPLLRRRARALARDGARRLPAAAHAVARR